jgi:hypothetical protein
MCINGDHVRREELGSDQDDRAAIDRGCNVARCVYLGMYHFEVADSPSEIV